MQTNQSYTSRISSLVPDRSLSASLSLDLQLKAAEVNKTLSRNDGSPDKSLKVMKEDIQAMLAEMRKRQLAGQKSIAEDELEYGHTNKPTNTRVPCLLSLWPFLYRWICIYENASSLCRQCWGGRWVNSLHGSRGRNRLWHRVHLLFWACMPQKMKKKSFKK